jgi:hypothetical protein
MLAGGRRITTLATTQGSVMSPESKHEQSRGRRKAPSSAWRPGQSGNPGGRPRVAGEVRELARQHGYEAIRRLVAHMHSKNEGVAVRACEALLDRGYGRTVQGVELSAGAMSARFRVEFVPVPKRVDAAPACDTPTSIGFPQLTYESSYPSTGRIIA